MCYGGYHDITVGDIPCVILVRDGSIIPHAELAQHTADIDWSNIELREYRTASDVKCTGIIFKPGDEAIQTVER